MLILPIIFLLLLVLIFCSSSKAIFCFPLPDKTHPGRSNQIEEAIYQEIRYTDMKYKNRVWSRISNLKDAKNPNLRKNVLYGNIPPDLLTRMTAEEMASDELKDMRKRLTKYAIREHQIAKTGGTQTDLFTCGKCNKNNCTYTRVQICSADEPLTTFVVCNECRNWWRKFCWVWKNWQGIWTIKKN